MKDKKKIIDYLFLIGYIGVISDIRDVILNVLGGLLGLVLIILFSREREDKPPCSD